MAENIYSGPLFNIAAGILAASKPGVNAGAAIGQGLLTGQQETRLQDVNARRQAEEERRAIAFQAQQEALAQRMLQGQRQAELFQSMMIPQPTMPVPQSPDSQQMAQLTPGMPGQLAQQMTSMGVPQTPFMQGQFGTQERAGPMPLADKAHNRDMSFFAKMAKSTPGGFSPETMLGIYQAPFQRQSAAAAADLAYQRALEKSRLEIEGRENVARIGANKPIALSEKQRLASPTGQVLLDSAVAPGGVDIAEQAGLANTLRDDFRAETKLFDVIDSNYTNVVTASDDGMGDLARVFGYMKILDPGSTVREGEAASVANAGGVPARIRSLYNKLLGGGELDGPQRLALERQADAIYRKSREKYENKISDYRTMATEQGVPLTQVVGTELPLREQRKRKKKGDLPGDESDFIDLEPKRQNNYQSGVGF